MIVQLVNASKENRHFKNLSAFVVSRFIKKTEVDCSYWCWVGLQDLLAIFSHRVLGAACDWPSCFPQPRHTHRSLGKTPKPAENTFFSAGCISRHTRVFV